MLTSSTERFRKIQKETPEEFQKYLVQVTKYQAAQHCKVWPNMNDTYRSCINIKCRRILDRIQFFSIAVLDSW